MVGARIRIEVERPSGTVLSAEWRDEPPGAGVEHVGRQLGEMLAITLGHEAMAVLVAAMLATEGQGYGTIGPMRGHAASVLAAANKYNAERIRNGNA